MAKLYCIGGTTIDLVGRPYQKLNLYDSNPGQVKLSLGGVARNIAENAVKMNAEVYLMSLFGKDALGQFAYQQCEKLSWIYDTVVLLKDRIQPVILLCWMTMVKCFLAWQTWRFSVNSKNVILRPSSVQCMKTIIVRSILI